MSRSPQNQTLKLLRKARIEQLRLRHGSSGSVVRSAPAGPVPARPVPATPIPIPRPTTSGRMPLYIYQSEAAFIVRTSRQFESIETCWQLLGTSSPSGVTVVTYVVDCGPNAIHEATFCRPDQTYLEREGSRLVRRYGRRHVGGAHSHPRLGLNEPSGHDVRATIDGMRSEGLQRFVQMIVTYDDVNTRLNAFMFTPDGYERMDLQVLLGTSPVRKMEESL